MRSKFITFWEIWEKINNNHWLRGGWTPCLFLPFHYTIAAPACLTTPSDWFPGAAEYCLTESFTARCGWNELILIDKALFGRMELGKCVTRNFGHVGCQTDVLNQLDHACSGLPQCDFSVSDPSLVRMKPCPKDFTSYLDATYDCVPGMESFTMLI